MGCNSCKNSKAEKLIKNINKIQGNDENESITHYNDFSVKHKIQSFLYKFFMFIIILVFGTILAPFVMILFTMIVIFKFEVKIPYLGNFNRKK